MIPEPTRNGRVPTAARTAAERLRGLASRPDLLTWAAVGLVLLASAVLHVWQLDRTGLRGDEAVYAGQAAVLADAPGYERHFLLSSRGNSNFLLFQALLSLVYRVVGVSDIAARLVSASLSTATVLVVFLIGRRLYGRLAGVLGAALLAVSAYALSLGRLALLDPLLALLFAVGLLCLVSWDTTRRPQWLVAFAAVCSLAVQAKVVGVLLLAVLALHLAVTGDGRRIGWRTAGLAAGAFVVCLAPAALQLATRGDEVVAFLGSSLQRRSSVPWFYYLRVLHTYEGLPFLLLWLGGIGYALVRRRRADLLPLLTLFVVGLFFQAWPLKAFNYALVAVPPLCLLAGRALAELRLPFARLERHVPRAGLVPAWALNPLAGFVVLLVAVPHLQAVLKDNTAAGLREAAAWLSTHAAPGDGVMTLSHGSAQYVFAFYGHHDAYPYGRFQLATVLPGPEVVTPRPDPLGGTPRDWVTTQPARMLQDGNVRYLTYYNNKLAGLTPQQEDPVTVDPIVATSTQRRFQKLIAAYGGTLVHTVRQGREPTAWIYEVGRSQPRPTGTYTVQDEVVQLSAVGFLRNSAVDIRYRGESVATARSDDTGALEAAFPLPSGTAERYRLVATDESGRYLSLTGLPRPEGSFVVQDGTVLVQATGFTPGAKVSATYRGARHGDAVADRAGELTMSFALPIGTRPRYRLLLADGAGNTVTLTQLPTPTLQAATGRGTVTATGAGFGADRPVTLTYHGLPVASARTDAAGAFRASFPVPRSVRADYRLRATDGAGYTATTSRLSGS